jgi:small-conductance mechanosensitive channel/CRP-like cAMP-binding protein
MQSPRALLLVPFLLAIVMGAAGSWLLVHSRAKPLPDSLAHAPIPIATPPPGAQLDQWFEDAVCEVERDGSLLVFGGLLLVATLLRAAVPSSQRRMRTSVFMFFLYAITIPCGAVLVSGGNLDSYAYVRGVAVFCEGVAITNLVAILVFDVTFGLARLRVPPILREILTGTSYILVTLVLFRRGGFPLGSILTTSAVLTAVVGLSVQSTLGDAVSGVVLEWEDTIQVGDWVKIGSDVNGQVKEIRWRHMTIETRNWETLVIPNSVVMKSNVVICGKRTGQPVQLRRWLYFQVPYEFMPNQVIAAVNDAVQAAPIERVALDPKPHCILYDFREYAGYYAVRYWLTDLAVDDPTDSVVRTRIHAALKRAGIPFALPARALDVKTQDEQARTRETAERLEERLGVIRRCTLFSMLMQDECYSLVPHIVHAPFAKGEVMTRQGAEAHWLYMVDRGQASVWLELPSHERKRIATLEAGGYFGEMALLTGEPRSATVVAETDVDCWRLDREGFKQVIERRPEIAQELARILTARRILLAEARDTEKTHSRADVESSLLREITGFFGLSSV